MPLVMVNNVWLNYLEQGTGDEVIVFVHGHMMSSGAWKEVLELLPKEYHAYAIDQRGFGQSEKPGGYNLAQFADDVYSFSRELDLSKFTYVGHSMSGLIGIQLALTHPDVLKALVLTTPAPAHRLEMMPDMLTMMQSMGFTGMATAMKSMVGSPEAIRGFIAMMFAKLPSEERMDELVKDVLATDPQAMEGCFTWIMSPGLEPRLWEIKVPTLIVAGGKDFVPVDAIRRTASGIKECRLEVFEDNKHMLFAESPQRFVDLLTSFIKKAT